MGFLLMKYNDIEKASKGAKAEQIELLRDIRDLMKELNEALLGK